MNAPASPPAPPTTSHDPLRDTTLYINRELSQLDFNFRVLAQAQDPQVPLLERLRCGHLNGRGHLLVPLLRKTVTRQHQRVGK